MAVCFYLRFRSGKWKTMRRHRAGRGCGGGRGKSERRRPWREPPRSASGVAVLPARSAAVIIGLMSDVTHILNAIEQGDPHAAEQLWPLVYDELRRLAGRTAGPREAGPDARRHRPGPRGLPAAGGRPGPGLRQPPPLLRRRRRGHAPHPRRARPPQGAARSAAAGGGASTPTSTPSTPAGPPRSCWPCTRPWSSSRPTTRSRPSSSSCASSAG